MKVTDSKFLILFTLLLLSWASFHWPALMGMEAIWRRSDTFAHGYFILPIALWLIWRDKNVLLTASVSTSWLGALVFIGASLLGLVAAVADVNVVSQLAAVISFASLIWLCIGDKLAWHYKFPLAYLLFLVPMGENFIPWLQDVTAWFTVFFLQLTGIPVYRDGLYIQTPNGLFEVAVACSGIRYLIASAAVGTLFAYLSYTKFKKQLFFTLFAFVLPVVANGIRAYLIVLIAHYSNMKYATGADHLIYGWIFFGLVIMFMFWVGGKFTDPQGNAIESDKEKVGSFRPLVYAMALTTTVVSSLVLKQLYFENAPQTPTTLFKGALVTQSNWGINFEYPIAKSFVNQHGVEFFSVKYANKQDKGELISFNNKLHDPDSWTVIEHAQELYNNREYNYLLLRNIRGQERAYVYLYAIGPFTTGSNIKAKLYQVFVSLSGMSDYSYLHAASVFGAGNMLPGKNKLISTLDNQIALLDDSK